MDSEVAGELYDSTGNTLLDIQTISGVADIDDGDYYVIGLGNGTSTGVIFKPNDPDAMHDKGNVTITATVKGQEGGATNVVTSTQDVGTAFKPVNSGYDLEVTNPEGTENPSSNKADDGSNLIEVKVGGTGLNDITTEKIDTILLGNLPNGFLVYVGKDAASATEATMANNAGGEGTNTWLLGDEMPKYIGILPPKNWSGTVKDIKFTVISGEPSLTEKDITDECFDLTATPVADGVTLDPTASFGNEGEIIGLNLNANLKDLHQAGDSDQHVELITLEFSGMGEHAAFYVDGALISGTDRVTDNGNGTYTIKGLSQDDVDKLGFIQANSAIDSGGIKVKAQSQEYELDGDGKPDLTKPVVADDATSAWTGQETITTNIVDQYGTTDNDTLLWTGDYINGRDGEDTVQLRFGEELEGRTLATQLDNIEIIDMQGNGANSIKSLSVEDVIDMTDTDNELSIFGDSQDSVELSKGEWTEGATQDGYTIYTGANNTELKIYDVTTTIID